MSKYNSMDIYSKPGTKVTYLGRNGYDYDVKRANEVLKVGQIYTIIGVEIHPFKSYIELDGIPGKFNSVMFDHIRLV